MLPSVNHEMISTMFMENLPKRMRGDPRDVEVWKDIMNMDAGLVALLCDTIHSYLGDELT